MTLIVMPVICMITRAVSTDSGMLTAATSVERTLNRNRKIVRIAKSAPRPPSLSRPSRDSLMNVERSEMTVTLTTSALAWPISSSFWVTASATSTVFALDVLVTVRVSEGTPSVRAKPVVGTPASRTVAMSFRKTGTGATGVVGTVPGCGVVPGVVLVAFTPTTRFSIWAIDVSVPIVETGTFVVGDLIWPEGRVRLFAARTPLTWATEMPVAVSFAGSSVITTSGWSPPVRSTVATPSMPWRAGTISVRATSVAASRPSWLVPATDAMITGEELMLSAETCGETLLGRPASWRFCSIVDRASLMSVPNSNWATTMAIELADEEESAESRGTLATDRSIGLVTWLATSAAPTPG